MEIREMLNKKYYMDWKPQYSAWNLKEEEITDEYLINMYNEHINKLTEFIDEIEEIEKGITKKNFKPNYRQTGGFHRCITDYPDKGWKEKYHQYAQAYTEMMSDFLFYSPTLEYDEMSLDEISILKKMAGIMIERAKDNIKEMKGVV